MQAGIGLVPGAGLQGGYVEARRLYTREIELVTDYAPEALGGESRLQISGAIGGAIRATGVIRLLTDKSPLYDVDVGARIGPGLSFDVNDATRESKNQTFILFVEPFTRLTATFGLGRTLFAEIGTQRPKLRFGLWIPLAPSAR